MARPNREEHGVIVRDETTELEAGEMVSGMSPAMLKALVESLVSAAMAGQANTTDAIRDLIKEQGRTSLKSNAQHPGISVFSYPEGEIARPKPRLNMKSYLNSIMFHEDTMTPAEIELLNALNSDRECRGGKWKVEIRDGRRLLWMPIKTMDDRASLPESLSIILLELATGNETLNPNFLVDEVLKLRKQVAEMAAA
jgi:hypothetical protein